MSAAQLLNPKAESRVRPVCRCGRCFLTIIRDEEKLYELIFRQEKAFKMC